MLPSESIKLSFELEKVYPLSQGTSVRRGSKGRIQAPCFQHCVWSIPRMFLTLTQKGWGVGERSGNEGLDNVHTGKISHFLPVHTKSLIPREMSGQGQLKCLLENELLNDSGLWKGFLLSSPDLGEISVLGRGAGYSLRGTAQTAICNFKNAIKPQPGSPGRPAAAGWPLMKWLLKEVGRLIPAAAGQGSGRGMHSPAEGWGKSLLQLPIQGQGQTAPFAVWASGRKRSVVPSDREFQGGAMWTVSS